MALMDSSGMYNLEKGGKGKSEPLWRYCADLLYEDTLKGYVLIVTSIKTDISVCKKSQQNQ